MDTPVGIIGGTGVYDPDWLGDAVFREWDTPYGPVTLAEGYTGGRRVIFLNRHGPGHAVPPHRVNYRANILALYRLGVRHVVTTTAVGSLNPAVGPGAMLLADQFLDFTHARTSTFFEGGEAGVVHTDMTAPYCAGLRVTLERAGRGLGLPVTNGGTYVCTEGPRFETAAEIRAYRMLGGDVVGMTGVPEVVLARELGLCYSTICLSTNFAAGLAGHPLTHQEVVEVMQGHVGSLRALLERAIPELGREPCACPPAAGRLSPADGAEAR
jgi:5'-methylthioadenosine phosphorylase